MTIIFFWNKNTRATLATKINKNQGIVLKTIGVNFCCQLMTIQDLPFVLAQMNATRCIGGQNKMIVFYSGSVILHAVGGG